VWDALIPVFERARKHSNHSQALGWNIPMTSFIQLTIIHPFSQCHLLDWISKPPWQYYLPITL